MSRFDRITSISLKNILSFGPESAEIALNPLNVLIGTNGSGKSNFLDCFSILQAAPADIRKAFNEGGGFSAWVSNKVHRYDAILVSAEVEYRAIIIGRARYTIEMSYSGVGGFDIDGELVDRVVNGKTQNVFEWDGSRAVVRPRFDRHQQESDELEVDEYDSEISVLSQMGGQSGAPEISRVRRHFGSIKIYRGWTFGRSSVLRGPQKADQRNDYLLEDASNLGLMLNKFRNDFKTKRKLLSELSNLMEGVVDFNVLVEGGTVQIFLEEYESTIPATRLSDGTLRYLALLVILCDPSPPRLVCIEEPELGLHPDLLPAIGRLMIEASSRTQLIVTTHSDVIIDSLSETPESVIVCERSGVGTTLKRLNSDELKDWLESYRLGELWSKGELGGNRW